MHNRFLCVAQEKLSNELAEINERVASLVQLKQIHLI
ncbi:unnamed protein product, partial [Rotaria sp. Silwood1]